MVVPINDFEKLQKDLQHDCIIKSELATLAGNLSLWCGRLLSVASATLITTKHITIKEKEPEKNEEIPIKGKEPEKNEEPVKEP